MSQAPLGNAIGSLGGLRGVMERRRTVSAWRRAVKSSDLDAAIAACEGGRMPIVFESRFLNELAKLAKAGKMDWVAEFARRGALEFSGSGDKAVVISRAAALAVPGAGGEPAREVLRMMAELPKFNPLMELDALMDGELPALWSLIHEQSKIAEPKSLDILGAMAAHGDARTVEMLLSKCERLGWSPKMASSIAWASGVADAMFSAYRKPEFAECSQALRRFDAKMIPSPASPAGAQAAAPLDDGVALPPPAERAPAAQDVGEVGRLADAIGLLAEQVSLLRGDLARALDEKGSRAEQAALGGHLERGRRPQKATALGAKLPARARRKDPLQAIEARDCAGGIGQ